MYEKATNLAQCVINDQKAFDRTNGLNWTPSNEPIVIQFPTDDHHDANGTNKICYSEIIISDEYISPDARVAIVPASKIDTDMKSVGNEKYLAEKIGQTLMMTPNLTALLDEQGEQKPVHGIAVAGNPFESAGTGTSTFTGLSKSGGTITEHTTVEVGNSASKFLLLFPRLKSLSILRPSSTLINWRW